MRRGWQSTYRRGAFSPCRPWCRWDTDAGFAYFGAHTGFAKGNVETQHTAIISKGCSICHFTIIDDDAVLSDDVKVERYSHIGYATERAAAEKLVISATRRSAPTRSPPRIDTWPWYADRWPCYRAGTHHSIGMGGMSELGDIQAVIKIGRHVHMHGDVHMGDAAYPFFRVSSPHPVATPHVEL